MHLLFDEQLSEELSVLLWDVFPDSLHVRQIGAGGAPDSTVWQLAKDRGCLLVTVVTINPGVVMSNGAVFEGGDGTLLLFRSARTRQDAEPFASGGGAQTTVLAIRPTWEMPAKDWIEADPEFWAANPSHAGSAVSAWRFLRTTSPTR